MATCRGEELLIKETNPKGSIWARDIWKRQANGAGGGISVVALGIKGKTGIKMRRGQKTFKMLKLLRVEDFRGRHTPPVIKPMNCTALSVNSPEMRQALRKKGVSVSSVVEQIHCRCREHW